MALKPRRSPKAVAFAAAFTLVVGAVAFGTSAASADTLDPSVESLPSPASALIDETSASPADSPVESAPEPVVDPSVVPEPESEPAPDPDPIPESAPEQVVDQAPAPESIQDVVDTTTDTSSEVSTESAPAPAGDVAVPLTTSTEPAPVADEEEEAPATTLYDFSAFPSTSGNGLSYDLTVEPGEQSSVDVIITSPFGVEDTVTFTEYGTKSGSFPYPCGPDPVDFTATIVGTSESTTKSITIACVNPGGGDSDQLSVTSDIRLSDDQANVPAGQRRIAYTLSVSGDVDEPTSVTIENKGVARAGEVFEAAGTKSGSFLFSCGPEPASFTVRLPGASGDGDTVNFTIPCAADTSPTLSAKVNAAPDGSSTIVYDIAVNKGDAKGPVSVNFFVDGNLTKVLTYTESGNQFGSFPYACGLHHVLVEFADGTDGMIAQVDLPCPPGNGGGDGGEHPGDGGDNGGDNPGNGGGTPPVVGGGDDGGNTDALPTLPETDVTDGGNSNVAADVSYESGETLTHLPNTGVDVASSRNAFAAGILALVVGGFLFVVFNKRRRSASSR